MNYDMLDPASVIDFEKFSADDDGVNALITHLDAITAPAHNSEKHSFTDPENHGICTVCGWVHPDVPAICKEHSVVHHLKELAQRIKGIRDLSSMPDIIEITIVKMPVQKRRPWPFV